jgi:ribosome-binding protein aMBF1 (putative translation factor)
MAQSARDAGHYRRMMERNPRTAVGFELAACAIYAARHGPIDGETRQGELWRDLARRLKRLEGETIPSARVLELMATPATVGERIMATRVSSGLRQHELAERLGVGQSRVADLEADRWSPSVDMVRRVADALDVEAAELI